MVTMRGVRLTGAVPRVEVVRSGTPDPGHALRFSREGNAVGGTAEELKMA